MFLPRAKTNIFFKEGQRSSRNGTKSSKAQSEKAPDSKNPPPFSEKTTDGEPKAIFLVLFGYFLFWAVLKHLLELVFFKKASGRQIQVLHHFAGYDSHPISGGLTSEKVLVDRTPLFVDTPCLPFHVAGPGGPGQTESEVSTVVSTHPVHKKWSRRSP